MIHFLFLFLSNVSNREKKHKRKKGRLTFEVPQCILNLFNIIPVELGDVLLWPLAVVLVLPSHGTTELSWEAIRDYCSISRSAFIFVAVGGGGRGGGGGDDYPPAWHHFLSPFQVYPIDWYMSIWKIDLGEEVCID